MSVILPLVFSIVMLVFMIYPAMRIVEFIELKIPISEKWYNILTVSLTIILSILTGCFIYFF